MAQKTLANAPDADAIFARLARLTPDAARQWGTMTPNEMLCHLADSFRTPLGEQRPKPMSYMGIPAPLLKWLALSAPLKWARGVKGAAESDPRREGTRPAQFDADRERVVSMARRFLAEVSDQYSHPMFGPMTRADWMRWGWLHMDHHLRQFGV
jgi:hypothetical protein